MSELVLPRTDAGVVAQVIVMGVVVGVALWRTWSRPDLRLLVMGVAVVLLALIGLRAAH